MSEEGGKRPIKLYKEPYPSPWVEGRETGDRCGGVHSVLPSKGQDGPNLAYLGRERPRHGSQKEPRAPPGLLSTRQLSQLPAVMPADSWHGREPKITQTAGARGCHRHKHWAGSQDTWNPVLVTGGDLVTLGESLMLLEAG